MYCIAYRVGNVTILVGSMMSRSMQDGAQLHLYIGFTAPRGLQVYLENSVTELQCQMNAGRLPEAAETLYDIQ